MSPFAQTLRCATRWSWLLVAALALASFAARVAAHDIPTDVRVHAFVKPEGAQLRLLLRVPLKAMRDIDFPRRAGGFVDLARAERSLRDAADLWITDNIAVYEDDIRLERPRVIDTRISLPSDRSFVAYDTALAHLTGPRLPEHTELSWDEGVLDVLYEYRITSDASRFAVHPTLARLGLQVTTSLRFVLPDGRVRPFELHGDPGLVRLDPRWYQAALQFVRLGFVHILDGVDHLLFVFCLVIPVRRMRPLIAVVTAFTVAHSITLIASAFDLGPDGLWFPPLVETLIATSIFYMALENIVAKRATRRRWMVAFGFGLVHGFGFSFALKETMQFAGSHLLTSLLAFNAGVELGQILVLVMLVPALHLLFKYVPERTGTIVLSALIAHTAWHWMTERWGQLRQFPLPWPDAADLASAARWIAAAIAVFILFQLWQMGRSRLGVRLDDKMRGGRHIESND